MKLPLTLNLPLHGQSSLRDSPVIVDESSGELFLIELQGELELTAQGDEGDGDDGTGNGRSMQPVSSAGQKIGKLDLSIASRPILQIGHHRLVGQLVKLNTPIAILKHTLPRHTTTATTSSAAVGGSSPLHHRDHHPYQRQQGANASTTAVDNEQGEHPATSKKRSRSQSLDGPTEDAQLASSSSSHRNGNEAHAVTPFSKRTLGNPSDKQNNSSPLLAPLPPPPSSAISSRTQQPIPATPFNVTELKRGKHEIVGILRKKILFNKRPEPIVRLEENSDED